MSLWTDNTFILTESAQSHVNLFQPIFTALLIYFNSILGYHVAHICLVGSVFVAPTVFMENVRWTKTNLVVLSIKYENLIRIRRKIEQNFGNFIFRNSFGNVPEMGQHSALERICGKTIFDGNCVSTHRAACTTGELPAQIVKRFSFIFQNACQLPLLPQLHLFHDGLDLLNIVLLFFSRTPSFLQRPGRLVTHQLQHQRPFLPQRSQACLCVEEIRTHRVKIKITQFISKYWIFGGGRSKTG